MREGIDHGEERRELKGMGASEEHRGELGWVMSLLTKSRMRVL